MQAVAAEILATAGDHRSAHPPLQHTCYLGGVVDAKVIGGDTAQPAFDPPNVLVELDIPLDADLMHPFLLFLRPPPLLESQVGYQPPRCPNLKSSRVY